MADTKPNNATDFLKWRRMVQRPLGAPPVAAPKPPAPVVVKSEGEQ